MWRVASCNNCLAEVQRMGQHGYVPFQLWIGWHCPNVWYRLIFFIWNLLETICSTLLQHCPVGHAVHQMCFLWSESKQSLWSAGLLLPIPYLLIAFDMFSVPHLPHDFIKFMKWENLIFPHARYLQIMLFYLAKQCPWCFKTVGWVPGRVSASNSTALAVPQVSSGRPGITIDEHVPVDLLNKGQGSKRHMYVAKLELCWN